MKEFTDPNPKITEERVKKLLIDRNPESLVNWPENLGEDQKEQFITLKKLIDLLK